MKHIFLIAVILPIFTTLVYSQEYEEFDTLSRNDFIIHTGIGLGLYHLNHNDPNSENYLAASKIMSIGASYFIANKINVGFGFSRLNFANNPDSAESARTSLMGLSVRYQTLKSHKTNIYVGFTAGTSSFKYKNLKTNSNVTAGSLFIEPSVGFTHFWGKVVGMYIQVSYFYTKYNKIVNKDNEPLRVTINGKQENFWLALSGMNLSTGILLKF